ncbi:hypothetical protein [Streptomyces sp. NPDC049881]|uniref:hypothetical protein n=1 Tax=Streptomyces sp. NPDC049881 TaxID=3155778 RepID=UPI00343F476A
MIVENGDDYWDNFTVGGNGNCKTHRASNGHDLKEGEAYYFTVGLSKTSGGYKYFVYTDTDIWLA